jgi:large subunit ribosomal protein L16
MLQPRSFKYRKQKKGNFKLYVSKGNTLRFGAYGLKSLGSSRITARQIEAARQTTRRKMQRAGRLWIKIFPDTPVSSKPAEVRMGKGKGSVEYWVAKVGPGTILFEISGVSMKVAKKALESAAEKLPVKTQFVTKPQIV